MASTVLEYMRAKQNQAAAHGSAVCESFDAAELQEIIDALEMAHNLKPRSGEHNTAFVWMRVYKHPKRGNAMQVVHSGVKQSDAAQLLYIASRVKWEELMLEQPPSKRQSFADVSELWREQAAREQPQSTAFRPKDSA